MASQMAASCGKAFSKLEQWDSQFKLSRIGCLRDLRAESLLYEHLSNHALRMYRQFMGLKKMDMGPTLRMLRTLSESPTDTAELIQAAPANPAFHATRPEVAAVAAESSPAFMQSPVAKQYREVHPFDFSSHVSSCD